MYTMRLFLFYTGYKLSETKPTADSDCNMSIVLLTSFSTSPNFGVRGDGEAACHHNHPFAHSLALTNVLTF